MRSCAVQGTIFSARVCAYEIGSEASMRRIACLAAGSTAAESVVVRIRKLARFTESACGWVKPPTFPAN
jgi:hypothetical protein